jgi:hypothetical protein
MAPSHEGREGQVAALAWRFDRVLRVVEPIVDELLATYVSSFSLRPVRASAHAGEGCLGRRWSVDGDVLIELVFDGRVPAELVVHDVALMRPLRKRLRTRRIRIEHVSGPTASVSGDPSRTRRS